jgi:hypothetical protein
LRLFGLPRPAAKRLRRQAVRCILVVGRHSCLTGRCRPRPMRPADAGPRCTGTLTRSREPETGPIGRLSQANVSKRMQTNTIAVAGACERPRCCDAGRPGPWRTPTPGAVTRQAMPRAWHDLTSHDRCKYRFLMGLWGAAESSIPSAEAAERVPLLHTVDRSAHWDHQGVIPASSAFSRGGLALVPMRSWPVKDS